MVIRIRARRAFFVLLGFTFSSVIAKEYSWDGCGTISLNLPENWTAVSKEYGETAYTFIATPKSGGRAELTLSILQHAKKGGDVTADLASRLESMVTPLLAFSEEKKFTSDPLKMQQGIGLISQISGEALIGKLPIKLKHRVVRIAFCSLDDHCELIAILQQDSLSNQEADDMMSMVTSTVFKRSSPSTFLDVAVENGNYVLTVPVSHLKMIFQKGELVEGSKKAGGMENSPRYFYFVDLKKGFQMSGWFESDKDYKGIEKFWKSENQGDRLKAKNQSIEKHGEWDVVFYETSVLGLPVNTRQSHMRAEYARAGTWIDLHCSVVSGHPDAELKEGLLVFLNGIRTEEKQF
jgi:hypothetical protein